MNFRWLVAVAVLTVVKSDRDAFKKVFTPFLVGKDVPWDKALYDRVQAIK